MGASPHNDISPTYPPIRRNVGTRRVVQYDRSRSVPFWGPLATAPASRHLVSGAVGFFLPPSSFQSSPAPCLPVVATVTSPRMPIRLQVFAERHGRCRATRADGSLGEMQWSYRVATAALLCYGECIGWAATGGSLCGDWPRTNGHTMRGNTSSNASILSVRLIRLKPYL